MLHDEGVKNTVPDKKNEVEGEKVYYQFYTKEQEKEFGVLAIKIEAI